MSISWPDKSPSLQTLGLGHLGYNSIIILKQTNKQTTPQKTTKKANPTHLSPTTLCNFMTLYHTFPHFSVTIIS